MKIIFDFDDVLFDTKSLKKEIFSGFSQFGITADFVENLYQRHREEFNVEKLYKNVCDVSGISLSDIEMHSLVDNVLSNLPQYTDIRFTAILSEVGKENCFIVSAGEVDHQKHKIKYSGLKDLIPNDHIIIVFRNKKESIKSLCDLYPNESIIFVDDKVSHIEEAESLALPNLFPILYDEHGFEALEKCIRFCRNHDKEILVHGQSSILLPLPDEVLLYSSL